MSRGVFTSNPGFVVRFVESDSPDLAVLVSALCADLVERYPPLADDPPALAPDLLVTVVSYAGDTPVGSGALRELQPGVVEIKHMFVIPEARGLGVARQILGVLEARGRELGYATARLGTGTLQQEAMTLYESSGYRPVPLFGEYEFGGEFCACYEKPLS